MTTLPDFKLETYFSKWEFTARYHMTASDAESMSIRDMLSMGTDGAQEEFLSQWLGYTETYGKPELRETIAGLYETVSARDILCFAGAGEGIYIAMQVLLEKGDHAIVITPNYQSAETIPLSLCEVTGVPLDPENGWTLDIDRFKAALRPNTKLVSINFPHNPTGKILERDRFDAIVDLCRTRGIWLFSDEVYRGLSVDGAPQLPAAADVYERGISLSVTSKAYGLPGLRIGWIACRDHALITRMERMKHYISISNSAPSEFLANIALQNADKILANKNALISENIVELKQFFLEFEQLFEWYTPEGGCVAFPRYKGSDGVESFATKLVEEAGVLLLPASLYVSELNPTPDNRFRIGFGRRGMSEGLAAMRGHIRRNS